MKVLYGSTKDLYEIFRFAEAFTDADIHMVNASDGTIFFAIKEKERKEDV